MHYLHCDKLAVIIIVEYDSKNTHFTSYCRSYYYSERFLDIKIIRRIYFPQNA